MALGKREPPVPLGLPMSRGRSKVTTASPWPSSSVAVPLPAPAGLCSLADPSMRPPACRPRPPSASRHTPSSPTRWPRAPRSSGRTGQAPASPPWPVRPPAATHCARRWRTRAATPGSAARSLLGLLAPSPSAPRATASAIRAPASRSSGRRSPALGLLARWGSPAFRAPALLPGAMALPASRRTVVQRVFCVPRGSAGLRWPRGSPVPPRRPVRRVSSAQVGFVRTPLRSARKGSVVKVRSVRRHAPAFRWAPWALPALPPRTARRGCIAAARRA